MGNIKKIILPFLLIIIFSFNTSCSTNNMKPQDFIGKKATYDADGQIIWGEDAKEGLQMLLNSTTNPPF